MASDTTEYITLIDAEDTIAKREGVPDTAPKGTAWPQLLDALREGRLFARGILDRYSNEIKLVKPLIPWNLSRWTEERERIEAGISTVTIPREWWLLDSEPTPVSGIFSLRRPTPNHFEVFRDITVNKGDIDRLWPDQNPAQRSTRGRKPAANWDALEDAIRFECNRLDCTPPDADGPQNWRTQADVERWAADFLQDRGEGVSESTVRGYVRKILHAIKAGN